VYQNAFFLHFIENNVLDSQDFFKTHRIFSTAVSAIAEFSACLINTERNTYE